MKNILILLSLFLVIASCKKCEELDCEGPDCLLTNESNCPPNMFNENNQCICPPDFVWLNDSLCLEKDNNTAPKPQNPVILKSLAFKMEP